MNPELQRVESVFNSFCGIVDQVDAHVAKEGRVKEKLRDELKSSALFTFEKTTAERAFALAKERGTSVPVEATPMPFTKVMLADDMGVVALNLVGESDDAEVLRRMSVIVYLHHLDNGKAWMLLLGKVDYINAEKIPADGLSGDTYSIDPRTAANSNVMRLDGPISVVICDGVNVQVQQLPPETRPAMRGEEPSASPTPEEIPKFILRDFVTSVSSALEELHYVNLPRHHIIEHTPRHIIENEQRALRHAKTKALRFNDRIRYVLVEPERVHEIRPASTSSGDGTHASPTPHARAGYTKVLRAERFKKRRWAVVHVRPTWVGDEEWDHGNVRYRVLAPGATL